MMMRQRTQQVSLRWNNSMHRCSLLVLLLLWFNLLDLGSSFVISDKASQRSFSSSSSSSSRSQRQNHQLFAAVADARTTRIHSMKRIADRGTTKTTEQQPQQIPFLIEKLPRYPSKLMFPEIAEMCIQAFFNDDQQQKSSRKSSLFSSSFVPPWKAIQLEFLRRLQTADLERRRNKQANTNAMFIAREVLPATSERIQYSPLILNMDTVKHREMLGDTEDVVRGEILGFVEVTIKPFGLGNSVGEEEVDDDSDDDSYYNNDASSLDDTSWGNNNNPYPYFNNNTPKPYQYQQQQPQQASCRPVLTNLSVSKRARRCGIGGALMQAAEETVRNEYRRSEMILEVEDDNAAALSFYQKRGYQVLYSDKTARRYNVSGLWLQQKRCTRLVLRKALSSPYNHHHHQHHHELVVSVFQKFRDTYRSMVEAR